MLFDPFLSISMQFFLAYIIPNYGGTVQCQNLNFCSSSACEQRSIDNRKKATQSIQGGCSAHT